MSLILHYVEMFEVRVGKMCRKRPLVVGFIYQTYATVDTLQKWVTNLAPKLSSSQ